jgi:hypothetical protein
LINGSEEQMQVNEEIVSEVKGTVRQPDGDRMGQIDELVVSQGGILLRVPKAQAVRMAAKSKLWSRVPGDGKSVWVVPIDQDGDGYYDYVKTQPDKTVRNNLLDLPIWWVARQIWIQPDTGLTTSVAA